MELNTKGGYKQLAEKLKNARSRLNAEGAQWVVESVERLDELLRQHLKEQGRGGTPPPLSPMTLHIYQTLGEPDGSGIHDGMERYFRQEGDGFVGGIGILQGRPTVVAKVQDEGAIVPVTDRMRGFWRPRVAST
ncbi:MAG: hypothetical protein HC786_20520 [Richelia sp. CSU_2_1]|nr:hypothetical protein [Richelia sp. CSU_2_1]